MLIDRQKMKNLIYYKICVIIVENKNVFSIMLYSKLSEKGNKFYMLKKLKKLFKSNPSVFYAMSIAATWAGGNSLIIGMTTAQKTGIIPFILWAIGNTLAPIVFGLLALKIHKMQKVMDSKIIEIFLTILSMFQIWLQMNNIQSILSGTQYVTNTVATVIAMIIAIIFVIIFFKNSFPRNVMTDNYGWHIVYFLIVILMIAGFVCSGGRINQLPLGQDKIGEGIKNAVLLIPGCFAYPVFWKMLKYNEKNEDEVQNVNMEKCFIHGGLLFGLYLIFVFMLALVSFNPILEFIKAILVVIIASSTLSSFIYSLHCYAGKKVGTILSIITIAVWQVFIPLGVLNMWGLMSTIRLYVIIIAILIAIIWSVKERRVYE